ncbi:MAG: nuclear transport factor 2 family protein [Chloroflexi bacterium]|nr:nuclear transport factor 2 family protein [Chloroflexota bacterium]MDA1270837.1 nuclear transport factor 2 family protein [Chloroflexota bacterium]
MNQPEPEIVEEIKAANQRFYDAFSDLDITIMDRVWENSERAVCVHPGWSPLVGWETIRNSWDRIFQNANLMQFQVRYLNVVVQGEFGTVTCVEGITSVVQGQATNFSTYATNVFARYEDGWRMIAHHAST